MAGAIEQLDVAIVGGGVSGAWCGWRLSAGDPAARAYRRIGLFECSDRIGGRLLSLKLPGVPDVACELGGMRYMSSQPLVTWLIEQELRLPGIPAPVAQPENIAYLRRKRLHVRDLSNASLLPYDLDAAERVQPDTLLQQAIDTMAPGAKGLTGDALRKAMETATYDGRLLAEQGFWNVLARLMSGEGYRFAQESGGYDTTQLNWNAADTVVLNADFAPDVRFTRVQEGYEAVPHLLAKRFADQDGCSVHMEHTALGLDTITLADGSPGVALQVADAAGVTRTVHARHVILAMPRRSLELLEPAGAVLGDPGFQQLLTTVTPIPLFKAFVAYHEPWWEPLGIASGRSVTDLPLRQVYYWSSVPNRSSVLLATYDDTTNVGFWQGLAGEDVPRYGLRLDHLPSEARDHVLQDLGGDNAVDHDAPAPLIEELHRQMKEVHGLPGAPAPYAGIYQDWIGDPYGGGVNFWNIGVKSWEVIPQMVKPVAGAPVYVCGEAYSDAQGWVEGALRTAEILLTEHLQLPPVAPDAPPA